MTKARALLSTLGVAILVALAVTAPPTAAHGAPDPRDAEVRLLHDYNDDCGGDAVTINCRGTHDLIALDVREAWDGQRNVLVFRFIMDEAQSGTIVDTLTFTAGGKTHTFTLRTTNDQTFTGSFDKVSAKQSLDDGTRFGVEGTVHLGSIVLGDRIRDVSITSTRDGTKGDYMPGGYHGAAGTVEKPASGADTFVVRPYYDVEGPVRQGEMTLRPQSATVGVGEEEFVTIDVENGMDETAQTFSFTLDAQPGVRARFHAPDGGADAYSDTYSLDLAGGRSGSLHLAIEGTTPDATGQVQITMTSSQGGRTTETFTFGVGTAPPATTVPTTSDEDKGAPPAAVPVLAAIVMCAAGLRRRS